MVRPLPAQSTGGGKLRLSRSGAELGGSVSQTCSAAWTRSKGCRDSREVQDIAKSPPGSREQKVSAGLAGTEYDKVACESAGLAGTEYRKVACESAGLAGTEYRKVACESAGLAGVALEPVDELRPTPGGS